MIKELLYSLSLIVFIASCGSPKSLSSKDEKSKPDKEAPQSEDKRMAFDKSFFEAMTAKSLNNTEQAKMAFLKCLSIDPENSTVNYELARIDYERGNVSSALDRIEKSLKEEPENIWYRLFKADLNFETADFKTAIAEYREVLRIDPTQIEVYFDMASAQLYLEDIDGAINSYDQVQAAFGITEEISLQKHQLHLDQNNEAAAENDLLELSKAFPDEPRYLGMLAQFYQQTGNSAQSEITLEKMVALDPTNGLVQLFLSEHYALKGEDEKSFQALKIAFEDPELEIDSKVNLLLNYFALAEVSETANDQAFELLGILVGAHPGEAKGYALYGDFYYREGNSAEAVEMYRKAIDLDPSRSLLWLQLLNLDSELNRISDLEKDSKAAVELFPTQPEIYLYHGIALIQLKRNEEATEFLSLGKEMVFDNDLLKAEFYSLLGDAYHALSDHANSDKSYDACLKLNPENALVLNNFAYYLSLRREKLEQAAAMALRANTLIPGQASFQDTYAWILFQQGKYQEAKDWQLKAISNGGGSNGVILEHYGDILFMLGDKEGALNEWKKAKLAGESSDLIDRKIEEQKYIDELE